MKIKLLETAGWYTIFRNLRQSYSLDSRSECEFRTFNTTTVDDENNNEIIQHNLDYCGSIVIDKKDLTLLSNLVKRGDSHSKIIRGLQTYVEITAPRGVWQEIITYCIGTLELNPTNDFISLNSQSTMHTILKRDLVLEDFEYHKLNEGSINRAINEINFIRNENITSNEEKLLLIKEILPESYLQSRTYIINYQSWRRIWEQRNNHRLLFWNKIMTDFVKTLPFSSELICVDEENKGNEVVVCFHKQITEKYLHTIINNYLNDSYGSYIDIRTDTFDCKKLAKLCLEGELTTMKCKINSLNKLGRYDVLDLLDKKPKQIDPRTIEYVEIKGKRYNKK